MSFKAPFKTAFDYLYRLFLIAVTLLITSSSCERSFSKIKLVKNFFRKSMTSERLSSNALLSIERVRAEKYNLMASLMNLTIDMIGLSYIELMLI